MKSGRSTPDYGARSRGIRDEHSVTSGTQTTGSFFSDDEEVESAIGLVVDTCHAAIQDIGNARSLSSKAVLDSQHGCIERDRQPSVGSDRVLIGQTNHKMVDAAYPRHQPLHGMFLHTSSARGGVEAAEVTTAVLTFPLKEGTLCRYCRSTIVHNGWWAAHVARSVQSVLPRAPRRPWCVDYHSSC